MYCLCLCGKRAMKDAGWQIQKLLAMVRSQKWYFLADPDIAERIIKACDVVSVVNMFRELKPVQISLGNSFILHRLLGG